jgi:hypothetical protein
MSGYLQRLVANAQAPNTTIRPLLRSLFSSPTNQAAIEGLQEIEEVVVSRQRATAPASEPSRAILPRPEPAPSAFHVPRFPIQPPTAGVGKPGADAEPIPNAEGTFPALISDVPESFPSLITDVPEKQGAASESTSAPEAQVTGSPPSDAPRGEMISHDAPRRGEVHLQAVREPAPPTAALSGAAVGKRFSNRCRVYPALGAVERFPNGVIRLASEQSPAQAGTG